MLRPTNNQKKTNNSDLLTVCQNYIATNQLESEKLAVACSAGVDSLLLLHLLNQIHSHVYCFHLDHSLRDDSHLADSFLKNFCKQNNIIYYSKKLAANEINADENSARQARYQFFLNAAQQNELSNILLAHNLSDQCETILFRLIRGTSSHGLSGMQNKRLLDSDIQIHRPWLEISKQTIISYAQKIGLDFIEDSSNSNLNYARNRIRSKIVPEAELINPKFENNIQKLANIISDEQKLLLKLSLEAESRLPELSQGWSLESFRQIDHALQRKILERHFSSNIDFCNDFLAAIEKGGFHKINFAKGKFFTIRQKTIRLETC